jgi:serine/threonine protein kinase
MGQVWRARDTKLSRDVALKILPDSFASDPDRLALRRAQWPGRCKSRRQGVSTPGGVPMAANCTTLDLLAR